MKKVYKSVGDGRVQRSRCNDNVNDDENVDLSFAAINPEAIGINESTLHIGQTSPAKKQNKLCENSCHRGDVIPPPRWRLGSTAVTLSRHRGESCFSKARLEKMPF